jgi:hypothetical protein
MLRRAYPTDLSDAEFAGLAAHLPQPWPGGRRTGGWRSRLDRAPHTFPLGPTTQANPSAQADL